MAFDLTPEGREKAKVARLAGRQRFQEESTEAVNRLLEMAPKPLPAWVEIHARKARGGNVRSLVALKCGDCCCFQRSQIRDCVVAACPLFPIRPYQAGSEDESAEEGEQD